MGFATTCLATSLLPSNNSSSTWLLSKQQWHLYFAHANLRIGSFQEVFFLRDVCVFCLVTDWRAQFGSSAAARGGGGGLGGGGGTQE